ncbi:hypothetical protein [Caenispirillum bisanense]|uniref:Uncharacterized protein n=1 Tax=Caenispirillum bisanense TaxID=414052 RepID=A0A286GDA4_9PROT|nr:hypothetical protein [Caenispirillum bisanense]SOD93490.1 hypothetical protein SAMN05421508_10387 [Caenispirillum bisanense]
MIPVLRPLAVLGAVAALAALTACQPADAPLSRDFGNAVRQNMAVHIINPDPAYPPGALPVSSGRRTGLAVERYQTGATLPLAPEATTEEK